MSYTWGRSKSPAYLFKNRGAFDNDLRSAVLKLFGQMARFTFGALSDDAIVIGAPPRTTKKWGKDDHLDDLLCAVEQENLTVLRKVLAYEGDEIRVADTHAIQEMRGKPVIIVDNTVVTGETVGSIAGLLRSQGASEVHLCIMSRYIDGMPDAIEAAQVYRREIPVRIENLDEWYLANWGGIGPTTSFDTVGSSDEH
ncbi:MAG: phosphoribosyltransferase family protein [Acidobacteria bacterium]|nr:phosphoribosyltransferase family protein [Acidobacteriota bacterium]